MTIHRIPKAGSITLSCDDCDDYLDSDFPADDFNGMIDHAKEKGWTIKKVDHDFFHYCKDCKPHDRLAEMRKRLGV